MIIKTNYLFILVFSYLNSPAQICAGLLLLDIEVIDKIDIMWYN